MSDGAGATRGVHDRSNSCVSCRERDVPRRHVVSGRPGAGERVVLMHLLFSARCIQP